jgi:hypothetical protein
MHGRPARAGGPALLTAQEFYAPSPFEVKVSER